MDPTDYLKGFGLSKPVESFLEGCFGPDHLAGSGSRRGRNEGGCAWVALGGCQPWEAMGIHLPSKFGALGSKLAPGTPWLG